MATRQAALIAGRDEAAQRAALGAPALPGLLRGDAAGADAPGVREAGGHTWRGLVALRAWCGDAATFAALFEEGE